MRWIALMVCAISLSLALASTARSDSPTQAEQIADLQARFDCMQRYAVKLYYHTTSVAIPRVHHPNVAKRFGFVWLNPYSAMGGRPGDSWYSRSASVDPGCLVQNPAPSPPPED
jgi:hypothetical protein